MANSIDVQADIHSLAVVFNRTWVVNARGTESKKEQWFKVKLVGAEGSITKKFGKLYDSPLQFKVGLNERQNDAKGIDAFFPKGRECAQLFSICGNMVGTVDMTGFDLAKWVKRIPSGTTAGERLQAYAKLEAERIAKLEAEKAKKETPATPETPATEPGANRISDATIPVETPATPAKNGRGKKQPA